MKRLLFSFLFVTATTAASAQGILPPSIQDGNSLQIFCSDETSDIREFHKDVCGGYITGIRALEDMLVDAKAVRPGRLSFCVPEPVQNGQLIDVVLKYLREHPETRHYTAAFLVTQAFSKSFPCKA